MGTWSVLAKWGCVNRLYMQTFALGRMKTSWLYNHTDWSSRLYILLGYEMDGIRILIRTDRQTPLCMRWPVQLMYLWIGRENTIIYIWFQESNQNAQWNRTSEKIEIVGRKLCLKLDSLTSWLLEGTCVDATLLCIQSHLNRKKTLHVTSEQVIGGKKKYTSFFHCEPLVLCGDLQSPDWLTMIHASSSCRYRKKNMTLFMTANVLRRDRVSLNSDCIREVTDGRVVKACVSVTWNVLSWSESHEFEPWSGRTWGA